MNVRKTSGAYLWISPFPAILVGQLRNVAGTEALLAGYAVFAALTAAAIWNIGAVKAEEGLVHEHPAFLPGVFAVSGRLP